MKCKLFIISISLLKWVNRKPWQKIVCCLQRLISRLAFECLDGWCRDSLLQQFYITISMIFSFCCPFSFRLVSHHRTLHPNILHFRVKNGSQVLWACLISDTLAKPYFYTDKSFAAHSLGHYPIKEESARSICPSLPWWLHVLLHANVSEVSCDSGRWLMQGRGCLRGKLWMMTLSALSAASQVNRLTTFSTDKIHSHGDNDNTRPIIRSVTECSSKQGEMPSAKCQRMTWVSEGAEGNCSPALNYLMKYEWILVVIWDETSGFYIFFYMIHLDKSNFMASNSQKERDNSYSVELR